MPKLEQPDRALPKGVGPLLTVLLAVFAGLALWKGVWPAWSSSGSDFAKYYTAARIVLEGEPFADAYEDFVWFQKRMDRAGVEAQVGGMIPHPPSTALVMLPLARLDPLTAKRVWTVINVALALLCIWLLARTSGLRLRVAATLFLATGVGLLNNILFGQLYLLLLASLLTGIASSRRRPFLAGLCFGALAPVKYVGGAYIVMAAGERRWRILLGGAFAVVLVLAVTVWWMGAQPLETFCQSVLGRHLAGEIQDPFASRFQSWNSLLRRLFVSDPVLNPNPALDSPLVFAVTRNLALAVLAAIWVTTYLINSLTNVEEKSLFGFGWISLGVLLMVPGGATYHFLLLTLPTVFFCALLLRRSDFLCAGAFAALHVLVNFPHYLHLESLTWSWWNLAAYSRLWLLTGYFVLAAWRFGVSPRRSRIVLTLLAVLVSVPAATVLSTGTARERDGAQMLFGPTLEGTLQIRSEPSVGTRRLLFYCLDLQPGSRAGICRRDGESLTQRSGANWYGAKLGWDDQSVLAETVRDGSPQIWHWRLGLTGRRLAAQGEFPSWGRELKRFAFAHHGEIWIKDLNRGNVESVAEIRGISALDWSASGLLAVSSRGRSGSSLEVIDPATRRRFRLLWDWNAIHSPRWSPSGRTVLFSMRRDGNRDIWAIDVGSGRLTRLTSDPANDGHPEWDEVNRRVVFSSDRGRGLGFPTLYWLPLPSGLR